MNNQQLVIKLLSLVCVYFFSCFTFAATVKHNANNQTSIQPKEQIHTVINNNASTPHSLAEESENKTDIIATVDAPLSSNILSWQDQKERLKKNPIEFSALNDALEPTDRDRLNEEIRYTSILNQQQSNNAELNLSKEVGQP